VTALALPFQGRTQPALGRSFALSASVHLLLLGVMFYGVRFQSHPPVVVQVELWEAAPPVPAPVVEPPKQPTPAPKIEPEPQMKKPEIVEAAKPKPKPKPPPKAKPEPPKRDLAFEKQLRQQAAEEQRRIAQIDQERQLKELLARQQADAQASALAAWQDKVSAVIRSRISAPVADAVAGNPEALYEVRFLPDGRIADVRMRKSSGNPSYDEEVARALRLFSIETPGGFSLPKPPDAVARTVYGQRLLLHFRPHDR